MREITETYEHILEVRKSRFIARAFPVSDPATALEIIDAESDETATHNCWAYRIGGSYRFSDDGEPGGTAGRPILAAIEKQAIDQCLVLVTRFFGGIKLGAGGLVRAYGGAAATCLRLAPSREIIPTIIITIQVPFDAVGDIYVLLKQHNARKLEETYAADGVRFSIQLDVAARQTFECDVTNATRGRGIVIKSQNNPT